MAIAEDDRLVFFPVYPLGVTEGVSDAFQEYDLAFAAALGLEPLRGGEYAIASIVARKFYDDGPWDRIGSASSR